MSTEEHDSGPAWGTWDPTLQAKSSAALLAAAEPKRTAPVAVLIASVAAVAVLGVVAFATGSGKTRLTASRETAPTVVLAPTTTLPLTPATTLDDGATTSAAPPAPAPAPPATVAAAVPTTAATVRPAAPAPTTTTTTTKRPTPAAAPSTSTTPPATTVTSAFPATLTTSGVLEIESLYSPARQAQGGLPTACSYVTPQVRATGADGAVLGRGAFTPGAFDRSTLSGGMLDIRCTYTYTLASLPVTAAYVISASDGSPLVAADVSTGTMSSADLQTRGAPSLYLQHIYCPECSA